MAIRRIAQRFLTFAIADVRPGTLRCGGSCGQPPEDSALRRACRCSRDPSRLPVKDRGRDVYSVEGTGVAFSKIIVLFEGISEF